MSKIFLTNSKDLFSSIKQTIDKSPFQISAIISHSFVYGLSTKKLLVDNENYISEGNSFCMFAGSPIYKNARINSENKSIIKDFDGNVELLRESPLGNYAMVLQHDDNLFIFNEESSCFDLYYYNEGDLWLISNSLWDMAKVLKDCLTINRLNILEELSRYMILDNETYFNEIYKLDGLEFIKISPEAFSKVSLKCHLKKFLDNPIENNIDIIVENIKNVSSAFYNVYGNPVLGSTGGIDSRMSLAAYLAVGSKPKLTYGLGNSFLAPSMQGDVDIDNIISEKFDLKFELSPWNETLPLNKCWNEYLIKYNEMLYDGCEDAFIFYTKREEPFVIFGYMGEFFREFTWLEDISEDYVTINQYIDNFHIEPNAELFRAFPELYDHVHKKWVRVCEKKGLNPTRIKKEDLYWINMEYRHRADSSMLNRVSLFKNTHYLLSEISILSNSYIPIQYKYNAKYMLMIQNKLCPEVLDIPIFSHCQMQYFDSNNLCLKRKRKSISQVIKGLIPTFIKAELKTRGLYKSKATNIYNPVYDLLEENDNYGYIKTLFQTENISFIKANSNPVFALRAVIIGKQLDNIGIKLS